MDRIENFIAGLGVPDAYVAGAAMAIAFTGIVALAFAANVIARVAIIRLIHRIVKKTATNRDDILIRRRVFHRLSQFAPALVVFYLAPLALGDFPVVGLFISKLALVYMIAVGVLFLDGLINAGLEVYGSYRISKSFPVTNFAQVAKLALYFLGFVSTLSVVLNQSPMTFIAGFGALAAVIMFVFKDLILGFVAGLQLSANRMVAVGDWIEMPKFKLDGDVMEIGLTTVKVRNFDKTITTVPTQSLINDSFKNWRGMSETGGRRIKRSIFIDVSSIRFCDEDMIARYSKIQYIAGYIAEKQNELVEYNKEKGGDPATLVNGRRMTNVGTFRAYLEAYLKNHPKISKSLTLLVRQLQPTENGLPIEIYAFSLDTDWAVYEGVQADIFDHILASAKEFDLRVFQNPTGDSFSNFRAAI